MHSSTLFLTLSLLLLLLPLTSSLPTTIGVTYSPPSTTTTTTTTTTTPSHSPPPPPPPDRIASTITTTLHIPSIRLPNSDPTLIRAFSYTNTSLFLTVPNSFIPAFAANRSLALRWIYGHVLPFYPRSKISLISVGNDAVESDLSPFLLPAIRNLHLSLHDLGITKIKVSTTFSFLNIITTAFPPSNAEFQQPSGDVIVKPLLQFLDETNSSFLVDIYPYNVYRLNCEIPIGFALFQEHPFNFRDDVVTGVRYRNLFDMMVDAVISAMAVAGHENVPVIVAETGWPSGGGDVNEADANEIYAEMYLRGLVGHLKSGLGTPLRKEGVAEAYIYELVDKEGKPPGSRNWGILYPNMSKKYEIEYASSGRRVTVAGLMEGFGFGFLMVAVGFLMVSWNEGFCFV